MKMSPKAAGQTPKTSSYGHYLYAKCFHIFAQGLRKIVPRPDTLYYPPKRRPGKGIDNYVSSQQANKDDCQIKEGVGIG